MFFSDLQLKREFGDQVPSKSFPGKKLFGLNLDQLEERRHMLENYIQLLTQDGEISTSDVFNDFFLAMQKVSCFLIFLYSIYIPSFFHSKY